MPNLFAFRRIKTEPAKTRAILDHVFSQHLSQESQCAVSQHIRRLLSQESQCTVSSYIRRLLKLVLPAGKVDSEQMFANFIKESFLCGRSGPFIYRGIRTGWFGSLHSIRQKLILQNDLWSSDRSRAPRLGFSHPRAFASEAFNRMAKRADGNGAMSEEPLFTSAP